MEVSNSSDHTRGALWKDRSEVPAFALSFANSMVIAWSMRVNVKRIALGSLLSIAPALYQRDSNCDNESSSIDGSKNREQLRSFPRVIRVEGLPNSRT